MIFHSVCRKRVYICICVMVLQCVGGECDDISVCRRRVCMCVMIFQCVGGECVGHDSNCFFN